MTVLSTRNLADHICLRASEDPDRTAVIAYARTSGRAQRNAKRLTITNAELERLTARTANGLRAHGVREGDRVLVFVRPGIDLVSLLYALYALGAVPVLIDPGLGKANMLSCVERTKPRVFIGIPLAHALRHVHKKSFASVELAINAGKSLPFCGTQLAKVRARSESDALNPISLPYDAEAAVLFTSGSTGPPKGVIYTHAMFDAQVAALKRLYKFEPGEVDVACLPAFGLFGPALGLTSIFPDMNATRPSHCDPERIVNALIENKASNTFGSPAIWRRIVPYCQERGLKLPTVKRVLIAGAPVPPYLIEGLLELLSADADVFTPYGATECLPIASVSGREILRDCRAATDAGAGTCVGFPVPEAKVEIIAITDEPIEHWSDATVLAQGEIGEVCTRGEMITHLYDGEAAATQAAKIYDGETVVHRMGDLGFFDHEGRLWFVGRKSHRLETVSGMLPPVPVECVFNVHPRVHRTALVGVGPRGQERPVLIVQLESDSDHGDDTLIDELRKLGAKNERAALAQTFLFHDDFPVDVRHNAKIRRDVLKSWAEEQLA